jgi:hypothetical protein
MYQNTTATVQPLLNESICGREVLEQIFVFNIVNLDYEMLERLKKLLIHWQSENR